MEVVVEVMGGLYLNLTEQMLAVELGRKRKHFEGGSVEDNDLVSLKDFDGSVQEVALALAEGDLDRLDHDPFKLVQSSLNFVEFILTSFKRAQAFF